MTRPKHKWHVHMEEMKVGGKNYEVLVYIPAKGTSHTLKVKVRQGAKSDVILKVKNISNVASAFFIFYEKFGYPDV